MQPEYEKKILAFYCTYVDFLAAQLASNKKSQYSTAGTKNNWLACHSLHSFWTHGKFVLTISKNQTSDTVKELFVVLNAMGTRLAWERGYHTRTGPVLICEVPFRTKRGTKCSPKGAKEEGKSGSVCCKYVGQII